MADTSDTDQGDTAAERVPVNERAGDGSDLTPEGPEHGHDTVRATAEVEA